MNPQTSIKYINVIIDFLEPLTRVIDNHEEAEALLYELGYVAPSEVSAFDSLGGAIGGVFDIVDTVNAAAESEQDTDLIKKLIDALSSIKKLFTSLVNFSNDIQSNFAGSDFLSQTNILSEISQKLINYLFIKYLQKNNNAVYNALLFLGIIEEEEIDQPEDGYNVSYVKATINWSKVGDLLTDPIDSIKSNFLDSNQIKFEKLLYILNELGNSLGLRTDLTDPEIDVLDEFNTNDLTLLDDFDEIDVLSFPLFESDTTALVLEFYPIIDTNTKQYTGIGSAIRLGGEVSIDVSELIKIILKFSANIQDSLGFTLDAAGNFTFINNLFQSPQSLPSNLDFKVKISVIAGNDDELLISIGEEGGSRFEIGKWELGLGVEKTSDTNLFIETKLSDGKIAIKPTDPDSFIDKLLPEDGIEANFSLGIGFSSKDGLYFIGTSGLEINIPTHISLGVIKVLGLTFGVYVDNNKIPIILGGSFSANLGVLAASVENIGLKLNLNFLSDNSGNLGPIDASLDFKPPNGVGLSVDAGVVKGGGYLFFDTNREEYAGALELVFSEWIALKAIGLVTTRMPDGTKGFSLLIIITVEFGTGIQLGFGFTLIGVGGLLGLNRTVKIDPLAQGVRTGSVESVMFPQDIVANAPRIISDLKKFFPVYQDLFLIGPMAKIGYGTPTLASLTLGLIVEFPEVTITILGVLKVVLPDEKADVLRLQVNFVGRIEPANKLLWFYAELYDSRVLFITLEGGMGLLVNWGSNSNFVFSVGGFHPRYNPPPLPFPSPPRLAVNILNESYARVRIEGYFAVTSNSVQFGARVEVFFGVSAFNIDGHFGFDALFQFDPFYFSFSLSVSLSVKLFGMGLFSVGFSGLLEGPTPWHIKGKGSIGFLFFSVSVPFEETWGEKRHTELPPIEVFPLIEKEIDALTNWEAVVPKNNSILVTLRQLGSSKDDELVLHPVGTLRISQRKLPLKLKLDKVGNQRPSDTNKLSLKASITGGSTLELKDTKEKFATGEFKDLDNAKKLSSPGFELYVSGLEIKPEGEQLKTSVAVKRIIRYETVIIDNNFKRHIFRFFQVVNVTFVSVITKLFNHFLLGNSVTKSTLSHHYRKQIQPNSTVITVNPNQYTVVFKDTNKPIDQNASQFDSHASAMDYLEEQIENNPGAALSMQVIPNTEINTL